MVIGLDLIVLLVLALTVALTVRAVRASRAKHDLDRGWHAQQMDIDNATHIRIARVGYKPRTEAIVRFDDPDYSAKVIEAYAEAQTKADDWNSTRKALQA